MTPVFDDPRLRPIYDKVEARERLSFDDGVTLYRSPDLLGDQSFASSTRTFKREELPETASLDEKTGLSS